MAETELDSVKAPCAFSAAENRRFRQQLFQALEELRVRRAVDSENEERIRQLVHEKHTLKNKLDSAEKKCKEAAVRQEERVNNVKQQQQQLIKDLQQEKKKMSVSCQSVEEEQKSLKDEIRTLELCKYQLEKRVKELEQKLDMQNVSGAMGDNQLVEVEQLTVRMKKRLNDLTRQVDRLQKNVEESDTMNSKLWTLCEEQKLKISQHKQENGRLNTELLQVRVKADQFPCEMIDKLNALQREKESLSNTLQTREDSIIRLRNELSEAQKLAQVKTSSLQDAHKLLERHIESETSVKRDLSVCQTQLDDQLGKYGTLKEKYDDVCAQREVDLQAHAQTKEQWQKQMDTMSAEMENLTEENQKQKRALSELEDLNSTWAEKNLQLNRDLTQLKCEYTKSTSEAETQTRPDVQDTQIQTEPVSRQHVNIQVTMETVVTDACTETMAPDVQHSAAQTDMLLSQYETLNNSPGAVCAEESESSGTNNTKSDNTEICAGNTDGPMMCATKDTGIKAHSMHCAAVDSTGREYNTEKCTTKMELLEDPDSPLLSSPELVPSSQDDASCTVSSAQLPGFALPRISESPELELLNSPVKSPPDPSLLHPGAKSLLGVTKATKPVSSKMVLAPMIESPFSTGSNSKGDELSPNQRFLNRMKLISSESVTTQAAERGSHTEISEDKENFNTDLRTRLQRNMSLSKPNRLSLSRSSFLNFPEPIATKSPVANVTKSDGSLSSSLATSSAPDYHSNQSVITSLSEILSPGIYDNKSLATNAVTHATATGAIATEVSSKRPAGILHYSTSTRSSKRRRKSVSFSDEKSENKTAQPDSPVSIIPETPDL